MGKEGFRLETRPSRYTPNLTVISEQTVGGALTYFFNQQRGAWEFEEFDATIPDIGVGTALVRQFAINVGAGQCVYINAIIEPDTRRSLIDLGYFQTINGSQEAIEIIDTDVIRRLKLARVFQNGGVKIDRVLLVPLTENPELEDGWSVGVRMEGHT